MIWCTYIGKTFCQVWTDHKLVNTTQKLQVGVMVTEKSFWDKKLSLFVESPIYHFYRKKNHLNVVGFFLHVKYFSMFENYLQICGRDRMVVGFITTYAISVL